MGLAVAEEYTPEEDEDDDPSLSQAVNALIVAAIYKVASSLTPQLAHDIVTGCIDTDNEDLLPGFAEVLTTPSAQHVLAPLIRRLNDCPDIHTSPVSVSSLRKVYEVGLPLLIKSLDKECPKEEDLKLVVHPVTLPGGRELLDHM